MQELLGISCYAETAVSQLTSPGHLCSVAKSDWTGRKDLQRHKLNDVCQNLEFSSLYSRLITLYHCLVNIYCYYLGVRRSPRLASQSQSISVVTKHKVKRDLFSSPTSSARRQAARSPRRSKPSSTQRPHIGKNLSYGKPSIIAIRPT